MSEMGYQDFSHEEVPSGCMCTWQKHKGRWYVVVARPGCEVHFMPCLACNGTGRILK